MRNHGLAAFLAVLGIGMVLAISTVKPVLASDQISPPHPTWIATASANSSQANRAIDGELSFFRSWRSFQSQKTGMYFQIDFGQIGRFQGLRLKQAPGSLHTFPRLFSVKVSSDGKAWTTALASASGKSGETQVNFPPQMARYLRIELLANDANHWSIGEMDLTGAPLDRTGWVATASHEPQEAYRMLDGDPSWVSSWYSGMPQAAGIWFQIDLGKPTTFNDYEILNDADSGGDAESWTAKEYYIEVSNDGQQWTPIYLYPVYANNQFPLGIHTARYIRVTAGNGLGDYPDPNGYWWIISEFNLYLDP